MQIDFTEARLAMKIDPSGSLLNSFIDLNNLALARFSDEERKRIGVHTCPGGDRDSTHSADVDYAELLPSLFEMKVGKVPAIALTAFARSDDRTRALRAGFLVHVSKPVEPSELVATVATVAGRTGDPTTA